MNLEPSLYNGALIQFENIMIVQKRLSKMAVCCYLVVDSSSNSCAVVDPAFDTDQIIKEINDNGWHLTHVINTHCHADHSAGNAAIIKKTQAKLLIHENDSNQLHSIMNRIFITILGGKKSPSPDQKLKDGDIITIGKTSLNVLHTPGHSPGSICLYTKGHVITGDTLFVGHIGRTDLRGGSYQTLIRSIHDKLYQLPPDTVVWPGHDYGITPSSTIKNEIENNPMT